MRTLPVLLAALVLAGCAAPAADEPPAAGAAGSARSFGEARVLARAPDLWHIEGIAYRDGLVFTGTAFGASGDPLPVNNLGQPSRVFVIERATGTIVDTILAEGEDTTRPHGVVGIGHDARGRLYGLLSQVGLVRWTEGAGGWTQEDLVRLPDIPPCVVPGASPCSPTTDDEPPIGNDLTWGPDGALYVSDSFQATIWRIDPAGAVAPWFQSDALDRKFGANGLRVSPDGSRLVVAVTGPDSLSAGPVERGSLVLSIPFPDPAAGEVETILTLPNGDFADGLAYGEAGDLFVLSNSGDRLYVLPNGSGAPRVVGNDDLRGATMRFPASLAFTGDGAIVIANYAYADGTVDADARTVIEVHVGDRGHPVAAPLSFMDGAGGGAASDAFMQDARLKGAR